MVNYAIVGGGRLARHFSRYFHLLNIPHTCWARARQSPINTSARGDTEWRLRQTVADAARVLLLVSDGAIAKVLKQYPFLHEKQLIHCSGTMSFPGVAGVHPLMTFAEDLYDLETYRKIPFMLENGHDYCELLPGLDNPHFSLSVEDKTRYHALCVMAGNFPQLLWKAVSDRFEQRLELPASTLHPYLKQVTGNFLQAPAKALTGPLTRDDHHTIERNLASLEDDGLQELYQAFISFYQGERPAARQGRRKQLL